ncbi:MAG: hypothetical protein ACRELY_12880 [Polyangiaceae bacterium]
MSQNKPPQSLEELVAEAKQSLKPEVVDWEKVDVALFAKIEAENSGVRETSIARTKFTAEEPRRGWQVAGLLAAAAAIALVLHRPASRDVSDTSTTAQRSTSSSTLTLTKNDGGGDVHIDGETASPGRALRALDTIETTTSHAELAVTDPKAIATDNITGLRVAWSLEDHSQVAVRSLGGAGAPLVLDLQSGAVEAQVTPVAQGEAFAVDLRTPNGSAHEFVRIAVHGTHLRVARDASGSHATIDLSEGVVSIGFPPKSGSTYGTLVTAPAHVEIDIARLAAETAADVNAIIVDKSAASVRAPVELAAKNTFSLAQNEENAEPAQTEPSSDRTEPHATPAPEKAAPAVDPHADETIRAAAQACAVVPENSSPESSNQVRISISSKLILQVGADGLVKMARFEPPLPPEAQECAGKTIYKTRFLPGASPREVSVPILVNPANP